MSNIKDFLDQAIKSSQETPEKTFELYFPDHSTYKSFRAAFHTALTRYNKALSFPGFEREKEFIEILPVSEDKTASPYIVTCRLVKNKEDVKKVTKESSILFEVFESKE
jgi:hypothetical protein